MFDNPTDRKKLAVMGVIVAVTWIISLVLFLEWRDRKAAEEMLSSTLTDYMVRPMLQITVASEIQQQYRRSGVVPASVNELAIAKDLNRPELLDGFRLEQIDANRFVVHWTGPDGVDRLDAAALSQLRNATELGWHEFGDNIALLVSFWEPVSQIPGINDPADLQDRLDPTKNN